MITVFCPTRGRPQEAAKLAESFFLTKRGRTKLVLVVDEDDLTKGAYGEIPGVDVVHYPGGERGMVPALNWGVAHWMENFQPADRDLVFGFVGDDHRFRTEAWDLPIQSHLGYHAGFAYGNDLAQGENLPTQCFITSTIVAALGWMSPPCLRHLYVDNAWKDLGNAVDRLFYFPDLTIEHMHPAVGKGTWDEGHLWANSNEMYGTDGRAFVAWREGPEFVEAVEKVRSVI